MYLHGPRLLADRIAAASNICYPRIFDGLTRSEAVRPRDSRWQATTASARQGAAMGFGAGANFFDAFVDRMTMLHAIFPRTRSSLGYVRLPGCATRVPAAAAVFFARCAFGAGKERVGINLTGDSTRIADSVLTQYGLLGFAEFGLTLAANRLHAKDYNLAASACSLGAYLVAIALEVPRLGLAVFFTCAHFAGSLAGAVLGAVAGAVVGALRGPPPATSNAAEAAPTTAGVASPRRTVARPDLLDHLTTQPSGRHLREALADCCRDDATFAANVGALDELAEKVDGGCQARGLNIRRNLLMGETYHLELLELVVGPLRDPDAFAAAYRPRSLRLHPDRLCALQLDERSRELALKARHVLDVANDLARSLREKGEYARVLGREAPQRAAA